MQFLHHILPFRISNSQYTAHAAHTILHISAYLFLTLLQPPRMGARRRPLARDPGHGGSPAGPDGGRQHPYSPPARPHCTILRLRFRFEGVAAEATDSKKRRWRDIISKILFSTTNSFSNAFIPQMIHVQWVGTSNMFLHPLCPSDPGRPGISSPRLTCGPPGDTDPTLRWVEDLRHTAVHHLTLEADEGGGGRHRSSKGARRTTNHNFSDGPRCFQFRNRYAPVWFRCCRVRPSESKGRCWAYANLAP